VVGANLKEGEWRGKTLLVHLLVKRGRGRGRESGYPVGSVRDYEAEGPGCDCPFWLKQPITELGGDSWLWTLFEGCDSERERIWNIYYVDLMSSRAAHIRCSLTSHEI
jgi:hypothetical protein